jgi:hypothetical protein
MLSLYFFKVPAPNPQLKQAGFAFKNRLLEGFEVYLISLHCAMG